jgi:hypothetical protein
MGERTAHAFTSTRITEPSLCGERPTTIETWLIVKNAPKCEKCEQKIRERRKEE